MKANYETLVCRMVRAGLRVNLRYRVVAVGFDYRGNIINLKTNTPRLQSQGFHAEERLMFSSPRSLARIMILRIGPRGNLLPIDPCTRCMRLALKRGVTIEQI
jgi:hypothetical protein